MSAEEPFLGEIYMFAGNFAPIGWALCNGQILSIAENTALFALIGTTYGGNGVTTFALPDLRSRIPIHQGNGFTIGEMVGSEGVSLVSNQIPSHTHTLEASTAQASLDGPGTNGSNVVADSTASLVHIYAVPASPVPMSPAAVGPTGSDIPHENRMPFLAVNFIIALEGIFPTQN